MQKKLLIMGLPKAGKTTLAEALKPLLRAVHFNADAVRSQINKNLGFSLEDRIEHARRMGWLCDQVVAAGHYAHRRFCLPNAGNARCLWRCLYNISGYEPADALRRYKIDVRAA